MPSLEALVRNKLERDAYVDALNAAQLGLPPLTDKDKRDLFAHQLVEQGVDIEEAFGQAAAASEEQLSGFKRTFSRRPKNPLIESFVPLDIKGVIQGYDELSKPVIDRILEQESSRLKTLGPHFNEVSLETLKKLAPFTFRGVTETEQVGSEMQARNMDVSLASGGKVNSYRELMALPQEERTAILRSLNLLKEQTPELMMDSMNFFGVPLYKLNDDQLAMLPIKVQNRRVDELKLIESLKNDSKAVRDKALLDFENENKSVGPQFAKTYALEDGSPLPPHYTMNQIVNLATGELQANVLNPGDISKQRDALSQMENLLSTFEAEIPKIFASGSKTDVFLRGVKLFSNEYMATNPKLAAFTIFRKAPFALAKGLGNIGTPSNKDVELAQDILTQRIQSAEVARERVSILRDMTSAAFYNRLNNLSGSDLLNHAQYRQLKRLGLDKQAWKNLTDEQKSDVMKGGPALTPEESHEKILEEIERMR